ncbi:MAG: ribonuclease R [Lachnospiraceae bacterium]|nr:ribonuclease R [Lachnospiraceae bacterium]
MDKKLLENRKKVLMNFMSDKNYKPMRVKDMAVFLGVERENRMELHQVLDLLVQEGKITCNKRGRYRIAEPDIKIGIFRATTKGFGFVSAEGMEKDIYIAEENTNLAFPDDKVEVQIIRPAQGTRSAEGKVLRIVEHGLKEITGVYEKSRNFGFVIPDNQKIDSDIFISKSKNGGAMTGHRVVVKLLHYGERFKSPEGEIIEILGHVNDPRADILAIVRGHGIPEAFSEEVMQEAAGQPDFVQEEEQKGRTDLRALPTVTIDGEDAKDLDDAITLTFENGIYHLGVHIADVTHYVKEGSPLDKSALERGTSVYLVDRVIPMLPHKLSNGICSLNQGEDRLALSCLMDISPKGEIISHCITESVIQVDHRMTYTKVSEILKGDEAAQKEYEAFVPMFLQMKELSAILRKKRRIRGSLDFDFPESKIHLDAAGHAVSVEAYERNEATDLIEDFMLAANETVAEDSFWQELPFLYRIHEEPDGEKLFTLSQMIAGLGYGIKTSGGGQSLHPKEIQKLLAKAADTPEEAFISRIALRSMKQARYSTECSGHFGLAAKYYCHFTSPIRRYPDLQIHRIIKENLHGKLIGERAEHYHEILDEVASRTSMLERRADEAERDTEKLKKAEYMADHIGEIHEAIITSITEWGMYAELPNTVEGLIHVNSMYDDFYQFDKRKMTMTGAASGICYGIGSRVNIVVAGVDLPSRSISFEIQMKSERM